MRRNKAARRSCINYAPYKSLAKKDYKSIAQLDAERARRDSFITGSNGAAALLCLMFLVLVIGTAVWQWY